MTDRWYDKTPAQVQKILNTDITDGLSGKVALSRLRRGGANTVFPVPQSSFISYLKSILTDFMSILLLITAIIATLFEQNISAVIITVIVVMNCIFGVYTYVKAQRVLEEMGNLALPTAKVIRRGRVHIIKQEQLVRGDVILLSAGDIVPADARLVHSEQLYLSEANLTGMPNSVEKDADFIEYRNIPLGEQKNMVFASTIVTYGTGRAVVCETGADTAVCLLGKTAPIVSHDKLKVLSVLKGYCGRIGLGMIVLIFFLTVFDLVIGYGERGLFEIFLNGLCLAVAAMSEFYMAFGYIIVACGIYNALSKKGAVNSGALIKNSSKLDKLRDITCLIVPKEGIFSVRKLSVERAYCSGNVYSAEEEDFCENAAKVIRYALISTGRYGGSSLVSRNLSNENVFTAEEDAIIAAAEKCGMYNIELEKSFPVLEHAAKGNNSLFDTTLVEYNGIEVAAVRGEVNAVIDKCRYYSENGRLCEMTLEKANKLRMAASMLAREAFRVVGVATKTTEYRSLYKIGAIQRDMIFEGFLAIREPMLSGVAKNVSKCAAAGIKVIMVCSDVGENNRAAAKSLGIIHNDDEALTGAALADMKDELYRIDIAKYRLYEDITEDQKTKLVRYLKESGEKVGIIGTELEDITLMKGSDIGFSQGVTLSGKSGKVGVDMSGRNIPIYSKDPKRGSRGGSCEALKFVSDVIISDADNKGNGGFNAITEAIGCAKTIYKNISRMTGYLITSQLARFFMVLFSVFARRSLLTPVQVLICGLVIDFAAVMVIAFEKPSLSALNLKSDTEEILNHPIRGNVGRIAVAFFWAAADIAVPLIMYSIGIIGKSGVISAAFIAMVFTQLTVLSHFISEGSIRRPYIQINNVYLLTLFSALLFIGLGLLFPSFGALFGISAVTSKAWIGILAVPIFVAAVAELYRVIDDKNKFSKFNSKAVLDK